MTGQDVIHSFPLDPAEILGVPPTAGLQEIREAFRAKSKKHHPDVGGDAWAFRVVNKAHEILCAARVAGRFSEEIVRDDRVAQAASRPQGGPGASRQARTSGPNPFDPIRTKPFDHGSGEYRMGETDRDVAPARRVTVEMLVVRFELDNPLAVFAMPAEDRNLSCSLNISWPSAKLGRPGADIPDSEAILKSIESAFGRTTMAVRVTAARSHVDDGRFAGWLTFTSVARAEDGYKVLHAELLKVGLGVERAVREVTIPRAWGE